MSADLTHVETWLFDLDNTLYPEECEFMVLIEGRMTDFVARETGLPRDEALALQKRYLHEHGTTLAGLMANHGVDPEHFLEEVHDVSLDRIRPDPDLAQVLKGLPGRRLVFTNADADYAARVLEARGIADLFDGICDIRITRYTPKPAPQTFARLAERHAVLPAETAFFEDSERNLAPAADLGMTTVLVGPWAAQSTAAFIHHRTDKLAPFLTGARVRDAA